MSTRLVRSLVTALAIVGSACTSNNAPSSGSGGAAQGTGGVSSLGGSKGSSMGTGGTTAPGTAAAGATGGSTVAGSGGVGTGGRMGSGGTQGSSSSTGGSSSPASGGSKASGGSGAMGGSTGSGAGGSTGSADGGGSSGTGADVIPSDGCGKTRTLQDGTITIQSRKYILRVPASYDNTHPYRLVFAFAELNSSAQSVADRNYFTLATLDSKSTTIFAAPDATNSAGGWTKSDVDFTDSILAQLEGDLCIDKTRIFSSGFSAGASMSMALACTRADVFRAVAFFSGADLTGSCPATLTKPIAYYASQASHDADGMDPTASMTGETKQAQFAAVNGCTPEPSSTTFPAAGQPHTCTIYKNCTDGHPTEYCVFNGGHGWQPTDPGQTTSWDAPEAWKFITQF